MRILDTEIQWAYSTYFGKYLACYKFKGKYRGNVAHCMNIWEVIKFILE